MANAIVLQSAKWSCEHLCEETDKFVCRQVVREWYGEFTKF